MKHIKIVTGIFLFFSYSLFLPAQSVDEDYPYIPTEETNKPFIIQTNKSISKEEKSTLKVNVGFFYLFSSGGFNQPYSADVQGEEIYYRMPVNSFNDSLYISIGFDWDFLKQYRSRLGWSLELNFGGSGDSEGSADKIESSTDLGLAKGGELYANFAAHRITAYLNIFSYPYKLSLLHFYTGLGAGLGIGWFTYNELVEQEISEYEQNFRATFVKLIPGFKIFAGFILDYSLFDLFEPFFLEMAYKISPTPKMKHEDFGTRIEFQTSGFMLGLGFRY
ncbi:MAG: hypothetical protein JW827_04505 [Spirochaetes bacterium]|nr:hypothetical protein [Spirochaetota bacterium]